MPADTHTLSDKEWQMLLRSDASGRKLAWMQQEVSPGPADYRSRSAFGDGAFYQRSDARGVTRWQAAPSQRRDPILPPADADEDSDDAPVVRKELPRYMVPTQSARIRSTVSRATARDVRSPVRGRAARSLSLTPQQQPLRRVLSPRSGAAPPLRSEVLSAPTPTRRRLPLSGATERSVAPGGEVFERLYSPSGSRARAAPPLPSPACPFAPSPYAMASSMVPNLTDRQGLEREHMRERLLRLQVEVSAHQAAAARQTQVHREALKENMQLSPRRQVVDLRHYVAQGHLSPQRNPHQLGTTA
eukprot:TRINITY_DN61922_c0_g1_i1.p1 TRINITY_DN61922_c0_g1~~TRINITY_DN61922_c0_g1_i1.p1  ORF type:complete len:336 (+),score=95.78 TRINITY_DN61922_c0_g1_i1:103-1008(+)